MLVKFAFVMQRLKKYLKTVFVMINKDGGDNFSILWGDTAVMKGDIELMGGPPTRENPAFQGFRLVLFNNNKQLFPYSYKKKPFPSPRSSVSMQIYNVPEFEFRSLCVAPSVSIRTDQSVYAVAAKSLLQERK